MHFVIPLYSLLEAIRFNFWVWIVLTQQKIGFQNGLLKNQLLFEAVKKDHLFLIQSLLHTEQDFEIRDKKKMTLLHWAVHCSHIELTQFLLSKGASMYLEDQSGQTALREAVNIQSESLVKLLLSHRIETDLEEPSDSEGPTSEEWAYSKEALVNQISDMLLQKEILVHENLLAHKSQAFYRIVRRGEVELVQLLLEKDMSLLNVQDPSGITPLMNAVIKGHEKMVRLLLRWGAEVSTKDMDGSNVLHLAAAYRHREIIKCLFDETPIAEAINSQIIIGLTPLHLACINEQDDIVQLLLEKGANPNVSDLNQVTALHVAATHGLTDSVQLLVRYGAEIDPIGGDYYTTPLMDAVISGKTGTVSLLIEKGANVNIKILNQCSLLHQAAYRGHFEIAALLLDQKVNVERKDIYGHTPLHYAAIANPISYNVIKLLLNRGAYVNTRNHLGNTPLHSAASENEMKVIRLLLSYGASIDARNNDDQRAEDRCRGDWHAVKFFYQQVVQETQQMYGYLDRECLDQENNLCDRSKQPEATVSDLTQSWLRLRGELESKRFIMRNFSLRGSKSNISLILPEELQVLILEHLLTPYQFTQGTVGRMRRCFFNKKFNSSMPSFMQSDNIVTASMESARP